MNDQSDQRTRPESGQGEDSPRKRGFTSGVLSIIGIVVSTLWLLNLTAGVVELPDYLPGIGNLDEVFFSAVLFSSLARWGIYLPQMPRGRKPVDSTRKK